jgi:hypothetical protein
MQDWDPGNNHKSNSKENKILLWQDYIIEPIKIKFYYGKTIL